MHPSSTSTSRKRKSTLANHEMEPQRKKQKLCNRNAEDNDIIMIKKEEARPNIILDARASLKMMEINTQFDAQSLKEITMMEADDMDAINKFVPLIINDLIAGIGKYFVTVCGGTNLKIFLTDDQSHVEKLYNWITVDFFRKVPHFDIDRFSLLQNYISGNIENGSLIPQITKTIHDLESVLNKKINGVLMDNLAYDFVKHKLRPESMIHIQFHSNLQSLLGSSHIIQILICSMESLTNINIINPSKPTEPIRGDIFSICQLMILTIRVFDEQYKDLKYQQLIEHPAFNVAVLPLIKSFIKTINPYCQYYTDQFVEENIEYLSNNWLVVLDTDFVEGTFGFSVSELFDYSNGSNSFSKQRMLLFVESIIKQIVNAYQHKILNDECTGNRLFNTLFSSGLGHLVLHPSIPHLSMEETHNNSNLDAQNESTSNNKMSPNVGHQQLMDIDENPNVITHPFIFNKDFVRNTIHSLILQDNVKIPNFKNVVIHYGNPEGILIRDGDTMPIIIWCKSEKGTHFLKTNLLSFDNNMTCKDLWDGVKCISSSSFVIKWMNSVEKNHHGVDSIGFKFGWNGLNMKEFDKSKRISEILLSEKLQFNIDIKSNHEKTLLFSICLQLH